MQVRRRLPLALQKQGSRLLHAQCWAWGQDVKRPEGNLLLQHGFERVRPPAGTSGCSQYTLALGEDLVVRLWGFGVYIGRAEGLYLNRFEFAPRRAVLEDTWSPERLTRGPKAADHSLVADLVTWVAAYEQWVESAAGRSFRQASMLGWSAKVADPIDLAMDWMSLRDAVGDCLHPTTAVT